MYCHLFLTHFEQANIPGVAIEHRKRRKETVPIASVAILMVHTVPTNKSWRIISKIPPKMRMYN